MPIVIRCAPAQTGFMMNEDKTDERICQKPTIKFTNLSLGNSNLAYEADKTDQSTHDYISQSEESFASSAAENIKATTSSTPLEIPDNNSDVGVPIKEEEIAISLFATTELKMEPEVKLTKKESVARYAEEKMNFASDVLEEDYGGCCFCCLVVCPNGHCQSSNTIKCSACCRGSTLVNEHHEKAAGLGVYLALSIIKRPKTFFRFFSTFFEVTFVVFSFILGAIDMQESLKDDDNESPDVFLLTGFSLALLDTILFFADGIREIVLVCRKKNQGSANISKPSLNTEHDKQGVAQKTKDGRVAVVLLLKKFVVFLLIYPIIICDLYGFAEEYVKGRLEQKDELTVVKEVVLDNKIEVAVVLIGLLLTLWDVYVQRAIVIYNAASDIKKEKKYLGFYNKSNEGQYFENASCKFEWRLLVHTVLVMLTHVTIVAAVLVNACTENFKTNSGSNREPNNVKISISSKQWFMICSGFLLPILSLVLFITSNIFWAKAYMIEIMTAFGLKSPINARSAIGSIIAGIKSESIYAKFSTCRRIQLPFQDCRIVFFSMIHGAGVIAFAFFAFTASTYFGYVIVGAFVMTDFVVLFIAAYWVLLLLYIVTLPCACCMKCFGCEGCWELFMTQMKCYYGMIGCDKCFE